MNVTAIDAPMCLRTHTYILERREAGPDEFMCPGSQPECPGGETYVRVGGNSDGATAVGDAFAFALGRFRRERPSPLSVWIISDDPAVTAARILPETTLNASGEPVVYLTGVTPDQLAFQAAHEVFHVLFTPVPTHHWTHELAAVLFSLDFVHSTRSRTYFDETVAWFEADATTLTLDRFMQVDLQPYPQPGFYGRAGVFGRQLIDIVGPAGYIGIATRFAEGKPNFWGWVDALVSKQRRAVIAICPPLEATS